MTQPDANHWLWRLSALEWLAAANSELEQGRASLGARRTAVTHARRAAGMALNAALVAMAARGWSRERCESVWGRSYIDHLRTLAAAADGEDSGLRGPLEVEHCLRCRELLAIPVMPPTGLVRLAKTRDEASTHAIELAAAIVRGCAAHVGS
ncbi:hypothetical protein ENSA5_21850 [Enhygromyxa salina]|uniref:Uncharacterized protein n=1 Tax=Enhygromyxa salina TaxID=215803 RepID=A0A2S9YBQ6_9BACT|nr:hypothetical protein [Enhygromyxa salina]PRQ02540.1 hypothetical protein ENSA5_21850 [Enhygromyxa salina]